MHLATRSRICCIRHSYPVIQTKICAEHRDMVRKAKVSFSGTCAEADRTNADAWGTMSSHSAQILFCLVTYIFQFTFLSELGWESRISGLPQCPQQLSIAIRMSLHIRKSNLPACLAWAKVHQDESIQSLDSNQSAVKLEYESHIQAVMHDNGEIWRLNVDLGPKQHILWSQCG